MSPIYADYNATTPVDADVRAAMSDAMEAFGNPSSIHQAGQEARRLIERARAQVANLIGAAPDEIVFTSGGTEADNLAVLGIAESAPPSRAAIVASSVEHQAVLEPCAHLSRRGHAVAYLPAGRDGRIDAASLETVAKREVALFSVMLANNDTGTIQPVDEVARFASARGALVHTDAVQAAGKMPIDVHRLGVSLLSLSSHKIYGPKGVGALYVRRGTRVEPRCHGGRQERSLRPGTENVVGIVGFGKACELARERLHADHHRVSALRDRFERRILAEVDGTRINGGGARVPGTSNVAFAGLDGEAIVISLDMAGLFASTGAACSSAQGKPSHVLVAMGQSEAEARASVRFSFGRHTTDEEIERAADCVAEVVRFLRENRR